MQKKPTVPQKIFLFFVLAVSLPLMTSLPFAREKAYAAANTDTPTVTLTSTPAFTFTPTVTATMAGSLNCGTTTTAGIVCTKVSPSMLKYTGSFMPAGSPSQIQMSFIKNFTGKVYFRMEEQGAGDFVYSHWIGTNPIAMQVRYKWGGGTATIGNVETTHYPWTNNNSAFEVMNPGVQDFSHSDAPDGMTSHAFVVWGNDPVNGKLIYFNSYIGKNNGNIINNSGAPVATGGGAMYISAYPIAFTPTPTATSTPADTLPPSITPTSTPYYTTMGYTWFGGWSYYWIDGSVPSNFQNDINDSADTWTNVGGSSFAWYPSMTDGVAVKYGYVDGPGKGAGITVPVYNRFTGYLVGYPVLTGEATTVTLDYDQNWYIGTGNPAPDQSDLRSVATHELGHALGLDHEQNCTPYGSPIDATMCPITWYGTTWYRTLESDDINGLISLYP